MHVLSKIYNNSLILHCGTEVQQKTLGSCTANHALIDGILNIYIINLNIKNSLLHTCIHFFSTAIILVQLLLLSGAVMETLIISRPSCYKKIKLNILKMINLSFASIFSSLQQPSYVSFNERMMRT